MGRPKHPRELDRRFWAGIRAGLVVEAAAVGCRRVLDVGQADVPQGWRRESLSRAAPPVGRYLSWSEREEIAALDHAGLGVRAIARQSGS